MAGIFARIFGKKDAAIEDATRIYRSIMTQARKPDFFGMGKVPDSYDGRIDLLTLHIAVLLHALNKHGEQGSRLSQAIYDVMRDDFEVALREEGISDTGIKRRIKPMMGLFFTRTKVYVEALDDTLGDKALYQAILNGILVNGEADFSAILAKYTKAFSTGLQPRTLGQLALADFTFPKLH